MALCNIRLATTQAGLTNGYLVYSWRLPEPDLPIYADHAVKQPLSHGGQARRGFISFTLTWDRLTEHQARTLRKLVEDAIATAGQLLYATIDFGWNSTEAPNSWHNVSGRPHLADFAPASGTFGRARDSVTLFVNNLSDLGAVTP